jgi:hypothetical protein
MFATQQMDLSYAQMYEFVSKITLLCKTRLKAATFSRIFNCRKKLHYGRLISTA